MVHICILPASPRACLPIEHLFTTLPSSPSLLLDTTLTRDTEALFWLPSISQGDTSSELGALLNSEVGRNVRFVQLPMTGVDAFRDLIAATRGRIVWCCAKGCYADAVAEHVLALLLALLRGLNTIPPASAAEGDTLRRKHVVILGAGSIAQALQNLLHAWQCSVVMLRSTSSKEDVVGEVKGADVVVVACALTEATRGVVGERVLGAMPREAVLVNVARGEVVDTKEMLTALEGGMIQAAVDVIAYPENETEAQQMQEQTAKLVRQGKLIVTPHSAVPARLIEELLGERIRANIQRLVERGVAGDEGWEGLVDADKGY